MEVRKSTVDDIQEVMNCINTARQMMRASGNTFQWTGGYPSQETMLESIGKNYNYVIIENDEIVATFDLILDDEPNYAYIENGAWLNNEKYGVIHRLASNGKARGVAQFCFEWCFQQFPNIKIDTHESNFAMRKVLGKVGYKYCGIIYIADGSARLAFQKIADK